MRVAIGGSRKLPAGQAPRLLVHFIAELPPDAVVLLRCPHAPQDAPGRFEQDVAALCDTLGHEVEWRPPEPTILSPGRVSVYARDIEMVGRADLILLFFSPDEAEEGNSGTVHLLDKALDAGRPTYAYTVTSDGVVRRFGEWDEGDQYAHLAPQP